MSVDIGEIVSTGFKRTFKRNGLILVGLMLAVSLFNTVASQSLFSQIPSLMTSTGTQMAQAYPLAVGMPVPLALVLQLAGVIASTVIGIGAVRTLVSSETSNLPKSNFTENILMPFLHLLVGGIVYAILVFAALTIPAAPGYILALAGVNTIGIILAVLGGVVGIGLMLFLMTALFYWNFFVIVEDQNFVNALQSSWEATEDRRIKLFVAGFLVVLISLIVGLAFGIPASIISLVTGSTALGTVINMTPSAFTGIFTVAAASEAYRQITE
ncbi:MAG: hypothetical protein ABEK16_05215 [Candidatus Nanohalobium sp.]